MISTKLVPIEFVDDEFHITKEEAAVLYRLLQNEWIPRDPPEDYEIILRLINGLGTFVDKHEQ